MKNKKKDIDLEIVTESYAPEVFYQVRKVSLYESELIEIVTEGSEIKSRKVIKKDIPMIVIGKLLQIVRNRRVSR